MLAGESCEYQITVSNYREGDLIEIDTLEITNADIHIYYGKNSLYRRGSTIKLSMPDDDQT